VAHNHKLYQIEERTRASKVMVEDWINGSMRITYQDRPLRYREIMERPVKQEDRPGGYSEMKSLFFSSTGSPLEERIQVLVSS
jgi:hypothetical protein